ncbi:MAG: alpha/beta hydrolase [Bacilli bacterium]|nr:alpha/beta hydrolase [Bacilli bacterium]
MDLAYFIAEKIIRKQKHSYHREIGIDYTANRLNEKKQIKRIPKGIECEKDDLGELLRKEGNPKDKAIFYIHGGGFCFGSPESKRMFTLHVAKHFGYDIYAVDYALAPEHPYPEGLQDCVKAYENLLKRYSPKDIAMIGDSAGGNLVVATLLELEKRGIALPASFLLLSPTLQYLEKTKSYRENNHSDCMVDGETFLDEVRDVYLRENDPEKLKLADYSPLFGDFSGFPKGYVIVSDSESLYDDSLRFKEAMDGYGRECELDVYHNLMHTFPVIPVFRVSKPVLRKMKRFIDKNFQEAL